MISPLAWRSSGEMVPACRFLLLVIAFAYRADSLPLSAKNRWIVDSSSGQRVKLRCANWPGHLPAVIPEGLNHKPAADIAATVAGLGFNCIRLTYSIHMVVKPEYRKLTVAESLSSFNLSQALEGIRKNNPEIADRRVVEAFDAVIDELGGRGVMVILDNHVSKPMWCCGMDDGNGFFGDRWFDPDEWLRGLEAMAARYRGFSNVIGMSMRNELRGHNSSVPTWYKYMSLGAETIHAANPDVLVIVSGLNYDGDLIFLKNRPFPVANEKIVFEAHWYAFSEGRTEEWLERNPSWECHGVTGRFDNRIGYVGHWAPAGSTESPLFVSEFGTDQLGGDAPGRLYLPCFFAYAAETDVDWAIWALQGSYYLREGIVDHAESYGVLDSTWDQPKNPNFTRKYRLLLEMILDPTSTIPTYQIIFHPLTGMCLTADPNTGIVELNDCKNRSRWSYGHDGNPLKLLGSNLCLDLEAESHPAKLSTACNAWKGAAGSSLQLSGSTANGTALCIEPASDGSAGVLARRCRCANGASCNEGNPQPQWFKVINSNVA